VVGQTTKTPSNGDLDYEAILSASEPLADEPDPDEQSAVAMCYTTGTTGKPKGVAYTHRSIALHTLSLCLDHCMGFRESDVMLPVVPMFHANAWGMPFAAVMVGAEKVLPGPPPAAGHIVELLHPQKVTLTAAR